MIIYEMLQIFKGEQIAAWAFVLIIALLSIVQISPMKINPWDNIFQWIGNKLNAERDEEMKQLHKQVRELWINNHRQYILSFARECRSEIPHSAEEWSHVLNLCEEYELYTQKKEITNGVVRENTKYLRDLYQKLSREHKV